MTEPAGSPAPTKGLFARAIGIITSPKATFEEVVRAPRPFGILFVCALLIGLSQGLPQMTEKGRQAALDMQVQQIERAGRTVTDEQYAQMERWGSFGAYASIVGVLIFLPVWTLILTAIFWAIFNALLGGTATFKQVLGVVAHSHVIGALGAIIGAPIQYLQGTLSMGGPFNLGALAPMLDESSFLARFLGSISVFTIWGLIVTAMGLAVLYRRKTLNIAIVLCVMFAAVTAGFIALMGSLMGR